MLLDFILRLVSRRQIAREAEEINAMADGWRLMQRDLNAKIADAFTQEEWDAVRSRCESRLADAQKTSRQSLTVHKP